MAKFAHNHLVTSTGVTGRIELREPRTASTFRLELPLESLVVDDEQARAAAGEEFAAPVPEKDREGTRRNLLGEQLLNAARQPVLVMTADGIAGGPENFTVQLRVSLRGEERVVAVPVTMAAEGAKLKPAREHEAAPRRSRPRAVHRRPRRDPGARRFRDRLPAGSPARAVTTVRFHDPEVRISAALANALARRARSRRHAARAVRDAGRAGAAGVLRRARRRLSWCRLRCRR